MSLFEKFSKALASESGELKKIRMESEKRRASKSNSEMPKVEEVIDRKIKVLSERIQENSRAQTNQNDAAQRN